MNPCLLRSVRAATETDAAVGGGQKIDKPDKETFDREVRLIRQRYGGQRKWKDPARVFANLFWSSRELDQQEDNPDLAPSLVGLIGLSQVDKYMWDAVNLFAQAHLTRGDPLPDPLAQWIVEVLRDQYLPAKKQKFRPRPGKGHQFKVRDWMMCLAVGNLVARGYTETRREGRPEAHASGGTACDIVGAAFFTGYKNVEKIWLSRIRRPSSSKEPEEVAE